MPSGLRTPASPVRSQPPRRGRPLGAAEVAGDTLSPRTQISPGVAVGQRRPSPTSRGLVAVVLAGGMDGDVHAGEWNAECAAHVRQIDAIEQADRSRFGETVALAQLDAGRRRPSDPAARGAAPRRRRCTAEAPSRAASTPRRSIAREQRVKHGGNGDEVGDAAPRAARRPQRIEALHRRDAPAARAVARRRGDGEPEEMRERQQGEHVVVRDIRAPPPRWTARSRAGWRA